MRPLSILIVGDHDNEYAPHPATRTALIEAAAQRHMRANTRWMGADDLVLYPDTILEAAAVLLPQPGPRCPRLMPEPELALLRMAREKRIPCLALGEAHGLMLIEFARNKLGLTAAGSTLYDDDPRYALITASGAESPRTHGVEIPARMIEVHAAKGAESAASLTIGREWTNTTHGLSSDYAEAFAAAGFSAPLLDADGRPALHILADHPCHIACTWLPLHGVGHAEAHPLVLHWLDAAAARA
ncbi:MAG: hypothetical protein EXS14_05190 [Planctomycetes bacterium]|nr:hypothetical protein [Planctomycetota bacterium]